MSKKILPYFLILLLVTQSLGHAERPMDEPRLSMEGRDRDNFVLAKKAFEDEFYDISQEQLERFLANYPQSQYKDEAHLLLGRCYFQYGKYA